MILAVTPGDPDGIGPEIISKIISTPRLRKSIRSKLVLFGSYDAVRKYGLNPTLISKDEKALPTLERSSHCWMVQAPSLHSTQSPEQAGFQSGWAIDAATRWVLDGYADALVTGPISKERLNLGGFHYPGHTEMLQAICNSPPVTMMLANSRLKVSLVTIHCSVSDISKRITQDSIFQTIENTLHGLKRVYGVKKPTIAVLALNPHAGESGMFGDEETRTIVPAMQKAKKKFANQLTLEGPFSADTFFALELENQKYDSVICQYHDQGLIPVKLIDFKKTINLTLGLPIIRTSVDHGTGFDIAGKGIADVSSFLEALKIAAQSKRI